MPIQLPVLWQGCRVKTVLQLAHPYHEPCRPRLVAWLWAVASPVILLGTSVFTLLLNTNGLHAQQIEFADQDIQTPVLITGQRGHFWNQGHYEIWEIEQCVIRHGLFSATGSRAVLWVDRANASSQAPHKVIAYFEGPDVKIQRKTVTGLDTQNRPVGKDSVVQDKQWLGRLFTFTNVSIHVQHRTQTTRAPSNLFLRASQARRDVSQQAQQAAAQSTQRTNADSVRLANFQPPANGGNNESSRDNEVALGTHRLRVQGRSNVDWSLHIEKSPDGTGTIAIAKSGIRATVEGFQAPASGESGALTIETDNMVVWGPAVTQLQGGEVTDSEAPLELYLEGNIIFRQGDRVIYADRMYYNVTEEYGMILTAEILTPVAQYEGLLRVKADVLQQVNKQKFLAYGAAITSSRMGIPTYWFQSDEIEITDTLERQVDPLTGQQRRDPKTNELVFDHNITAESQNNFLFVGGVPIFYWPVMATRLDSPAFYLDRIRFKSDRVYGQQLLIDWNAFQLFNIENPPKNSKWSLSADFMSERGVGIGTLYDYQRDDMFNLPGLAKGQFDAWGLEDSGQDNLGKGRRSLDPEKDFRGRIFWNHRQLLGDGYQLTGEVGVISDRNFQEQFYEREWDEDKDQITGLELKRINENMAWAIDTNIRTNDFHAQTDWLPRFTHDWLGKSLFSDRLTWYEHSHVGYARLKSASTPADPSELAKFDRLAGMEQKYDGLRAASRQEIDMPMQWGKVKVVPYLLGEFAYWGEDINHQSATRTFGQVGVRANLPMSRTDTEIQSTLFNVNGVSHKVNWTVDAYWADASEELTLFPRYDALDDDAQEHFRRRFFFDTFGGLAGQNIGAKWDERIFAYRTNMQGQVTAPVTEIADDTMTFRLATEQRWQTKRGLPGKEHIVDWMVLHAQVLLFPDREDNHGQHAGLFDYDYRWHLGDRFTVLSDGYFDFFSEGLRTASIGGVLSRPDTGRFYLGYRMIDGPISSHIVNAALSYKMSQKWIGILGSSFDLGDSGNIGQSLSLVRIGESLLIRMGVNYDESRDNFGVNLSIEPRFLANSRIARRTGVDIRPSGAYGFE